MAPGARPEARLEALAGAVVALLALPAAAQGPGWQWVPSAAHGDAVSALALEPGGGRLVVGDARGVQLLGDGASRRLLRRGPVRDLAFLPDAVAPRVLLAATAVGLFRLDPSGAAIPVAPAPGDAARDVLRIAVAATAVAVATRAGAFVSVDGLRWQRPSHHLPAEAARTVALRERDGRLDCFAVVAERLWRVELARVGDRLVEARAEREVLPAAREGGGPVDLVFGLGGADVVALLPSAFAVRDTDGSPWRLVLPALPPGARARRLVAARGQLWLATDRGLLVASALAGPWRRAAAPAGTAQVADVAVDAQSLYVAADARVLAFRSADPGFPAAVSGLRTPEGDPPIEQVHRAMLAHLDLRPERIAGLRRGVARRGWLPLLSLRFARARDEDERLDRDESFVSGETRMLVDRDRSIARDFEASLTLSWDLGDVAYHPEQIDVSREAREIIKLRDDVLDEVTQLYFERRRVLAELAARPHAAPAERLRLRLRAAELAAGIDAWTGGWFARARVSAP